MSLLSGRRMSPQWWFFIYRGIQMPVSAPARALWTKSIGACDLLAQKEDLCPFHYLSGFIFYCLQLHKRQSPAQLLLVWYEWVLCKWPVLFKSYYSSSRVQVRGDSYVDLLDVISFSLSVDDRNICLVCVDVPQAGQGIAASPWLSARTAKVQVDVSFYSREAGFPAMRPTEPVCVCRHGLHCGHSVDPADTDPPGSRSCAVVQEKNERVSNPQEFSGFSFFLPLSVFTFTLLSVTASLLLLRSSRPGKTGSKRLR